jgi:hypothetical protein
MHLRLAWSTLLCWIWACDAAAPELQGQRCDADNACAELVCGAADAADTRDLDPLDLRCGELADARKPGEACDRAQDCDRGICLLAGACARACGAARDCDSDQRCQSAYARAGEDALAAVSVCVDEVSLPRGAARAQASAAVSGKTDQLTLPELAAHTLHVVEHLSDTSWPVPSSTSRCRPPLCAVALRAGDDVLFARDALADQPDGPDNPIAQGSHVSPLTVWIPNSPRVSAQPRAYELEVESKVAGDVRITSLARDEQGQRLDLNLYYVGAAGLRPEGTRGPPLLEAALEEVERIFEPAGIFIGEVRQLSVPGELPERGSDAGKDDVAAGFVRLRSRYQVLPELPELLKLSAGAANSALDVFFVGDIESTGGAEVGGIAAGTPVAFGLHGGPGSGIAIAADMYLVPGDPDQLGRTLAHELGHALGLFHTVEPNGVVFDALPDTAVCPIGEDHDGSGSLDADECAAHGGNNLMFPTSDAGDALTEQQCEVLRRALVLQ